MINPEDNISPVFSWCAFLSHAFHFPERKKVLRKAITGFSFLLEKKYLETDDTFCEILLSKKETKKHSEQHIQ